MRVLLSLALITLLTAALGAQRVVLSLDAPTAVDGVVYADGDLATFVGPSEFVRYLEDLSAALPAGVGINAVDALGEDDVHFSLNSPAILAGIGLVEKGDVVHWDGSVFSLSLDGSAIGLPLGADIDALNVRAEGPLVFEFSLESPANLADAGAVDDEDIVAWDGVAFTLIFDGSAEGIDPRLDIDALNRNASGDLVMSFGSPGTVGGVDFDDEDLVVFSIGFPAEFSGVLVDGSEESLPLSSDVNAATETPAGMPAGLLIASARRWGDSPTP